MEPVRCYCCGKVIGNKFETFRKLQQRYLRATASSDGVFPDGRTAQERALDELGLQRACCRKEFITFKEGLMEQKLRADHLRFSLPYTQFKQRQPGTITIVQLTSRDDVAAAYGEEEADRWEAGQQKRIQAMIQKIQENGGVLPSFSTQSVA